MLGVELDFVAIYGSLFSLRTSKIVSSNGGHFGEFHRVMLLFKPSGIAVWTSLTKDVYIVDIVNLCVPHVPYHACT